jgi:hypothetical protein
MYKNGGDSYHVTSAVLFIIFNRPDETAKVFNAIRIARPAKLYLAADGPRTNRPEEQELCRQTREIAMQVDWDCEVKTLFRETNMGCKEAVSSAVSWFFENEEEGIILEDDCLPANSFFYFCDSMLERYRNDSRVRHISGGNFQFGIKRGDASYYFSKISHVWGWASWRRAWIDYDKNLTNYSDGEAKAAFYNIFDDEWIADSWYNIFKELKAGTIDTWDYQWSITNYFNNALCVMPNDNLISNIGFGSNATHTTQVNDKYALLPTSDIDQIIHPVYFLADKDADLYTTNDQFNITERRRQYNKPRKKLKRWIKSVIGLKNIS